MFDSKNLPLEPRKVIKKSFGSIVGNLITGTIMIIAVSIIKQGLDTTSLNILNWFQIIVIGYIIAVPLFTIIYQYFYYKLYYYNFKEDSGEIRKGVVSQATGHVYYNRIQNIYVDQDILDRIFGLYDVHYETAGDSSSFYSHVDGLNKENSNKLVRFLLEKAKNTPGQNQNQAVSMPVAATTTPVTANAALTDVQVSLDITKANMPISPKYAKIMAINVTFIILVLLGFMSGGIFFVLLAASPVIGISLFLTTSVIIYFFSSLYSKAWVENYEFVFDHEKGTITSGVFGRKTTIIYYNRIQNINLSQGITDRIFGMNNVTIETAAGGEIQVKGGNVKKTPSVFGLSSENAQRLKDFLLSKTKNYQANI